MYYKPWTRFSADNKPLCTECTKKDLEDLDEQVELAEVEGWIEEEFAEKHVREKGHGIPQNTDADAKIDFDAELGNSTLEGSWQAVYDQVAAAAGGAAAAAGANAAVQNGYTDEEDPQSDEDEEVQQPNAEDDASSSDETSELSDSDSSEEEEDEMMHTAAHAPEDAEPNVPEDLEAETTITSRLNHFERSSTPFPDDTSDDVEQQLPVMPVYSTTTNVAKPPTPPTSDAPIADVDEAETSSSEGTVAEDVVEDKDENKDEDAASEASFATAGGEEDNALDSPAGSAKSGSASGSGSRWSSLGKSVRGWFGKGKMGVGPGSGSGSGGSSDGDGDAADGGKLKKHVRFVEDSGLMGEDGDEVIGAAEEQGGPEYDADEDEDVEE